MTKPIIKVNQLSKQYRIGNKEEYYTFRDAISHPFKSLKQKKAEFWALKDVSFTVNKGEVLGVIGPNGAGKSTLLKILSRITPPTEGEIIMRGRVASLLEVGTGFHQELTGRENIYMNGSILGMSRKEIDKKYNEIVKFADIGKFLDTPIKHYSSGMRVKLAFSVAAHLEPEILLIDEVLAVGDINFQKKSLGKMKAITKNQGRTIIFVSHNMAAINNLCNRSILIQNGTVKFLGPTNEAISRYRSDEDDGVRQLVYTGEKAKKTFIEKVSILNEDRKIDLSKEVVFEIIFRIKKRKTPVYLAINILNEENEKIIAWRDFEIDKRLIERRDQVKYHYTVTIPSNSLAPGVYRIELAIIDLISKEKINWPKEKASFEIINTKSNRSSVVLPWIGKTSIPLKLVIK